MATQRQHYVSRFYLEGFTTSWVGNRKPALWMFERGGENFKAVSPHNAAVITDYYSITTESGEKNALVEDFLSAIEGATAPILRRVASEELEIQGEDREKLAFFLALLLMRVPAARERTEKMATDMWGHVMKMGAQTPGYYEQLLQKVEEESGQKSKVTADQLREAILEERVIPKAGPVVSLDAMIRVAPSFVPILDMMRWHILKTESDYLFLTSDNPVVYVDPTYRGGFYGYGLASTNIEVTFPIAPRKCLLATHDPELVKKTSQLSPEKAAQVFQAYKPVTRFREAASKEVKIINERTVFHAKRWVFSSINSTSLVNYLKKNFSTQVEKAASANHSPSSIESPRPETS